MDFWCLQSPIQVVIYSMTQNQQTLIEFLKIASFTDMDDSLREAVLAAVAAACMSLRKYFFYTFIEKN